MRLAPHLSGWLARNHLVPTSQDGGWLIVRQEVTGDIAKIYTQRKSTITERHTEGNRLDTGCDGNLWDTLESDARWLVQIVGEPRLVLVAPVAHLATKMRRDRSRHGRAEVRGGLVFWPVACMQELGPDGRVRRGPRMMTDIGLDWDDRGEPTCPQPTILDMFGSSSDEKK
jgi:hypothetical protein